jgi:hypothetical protein
MNPATHSKTDDQRGLVCNIAFVRRLRSKCYHFASSFRIMRGLLNVDILKHIFYRLYRTHAFIGRVGFRIVLESTSIGLGKVVHGYIA